MKNTEEKKTKQKNWFKEFLENRFYMLVLGCIRYSFVFRLKNMIYYQKYFSIAIKIKHRNYRFITNLLPVILGFYFIFMDF